MSTSTTCTMITTRLDRPVPFATRTGIGTRRCCIHTSTSRTNTTGTRTETPADPWLAQNTGMDPLKTLLLFIATALAEIVGCYLPYLWLKQGRSAWLLVPAAASLALFAWLLTLHETAAGRVYAAYGGVYIGVALLWLWIVDGIRPTAWDVAGVAVALTGMGLIMFQPR
jgi:small multidrug resistance family-3 protein